MKVVNFGFRFFCVLLAFLLISAFCVGAKNVLAEDSASVLYVPLIGITSVPNPLALPNGAGNVTYNYAVKNFLKEVALTDIQVTDDKCDPVRFVTGDDNGNSKLDYSETWRYSCTTKLSMTTQNTATATGVANNVTATHKAYSTVNVGSSSPPPLVSIVNTTKVVYPLSLPSGGGSITYVYKVNNPGIVPLSDVTVTDDKCNAMSGKLGDTNGNQLLDVNEVWIYTCTMALKQTTTDMATVTAFADGLKATDSTAFTVKVNTPAVKTPPLFDVSISPLMGANNNFKIIVWGALSSLLTVLVIVFFLTRKRKYGKGGGKRR